MEEEEKQRMEDFVRDLFAKTEDFNLLTKKIVRKKYLQHTQKDNLTPQQKSMFADIIVKLLFEFNVGTERSINQKTNKPDTSLAAQEKKSEVPVDGKGKSTSGLSKNPQEIRRLPVRVSCPKTGEDARVSENVESKKEVEEEDENKDVKSVEKKSELSENEKKLRTRDTKNPKRLFFSLQPKKRVLSRQILINNFRDKVKNSPGKVISNKLGPLANNSTSDTTLSEHPFADSSGKPTDDKAVNEEPLNKPLSVNADLRQAEREQKAVVKRLSAFEVLQSVLEDSNDGSVLSKSDFTDDDQNSATTRSSPISGSLGDKEDGLIPLEEISDSTPTRRRLSSKRLLESDNDSTTDGFTPPSKVKRIITSDSDSKNSPIRMRLFRNRIVDYSLRVPNTTNKRKFVSDSDSEIQSPIKLLAISDNVSSTDTSPKPLRVKRSSWQKSKALNSSNSTNEVKERKIVKPFRISISKKEILKASDSESDVESSPVIKEKKTKPKCKKKTTKHKKPSNHLASSSSSCDTDDLKLSQIKSMNQAKPDDSSDSDSELLINYTSNRFKEKSNNFKVPAAQKNPIAVDGTLPKLRIIHEKSAMDSDSDFNPKKPKSSSPNASDGKVRIILENAVNSENDCTAAKNMHICDTAQLSSPDKTPQKVPRKSKSRRAQILNSDSDDSDLGLGLRIALSTSSDSEDLPLSKKRNGSENSLPSLSKSLGTSTSDGAQEIPVGNQTDSPKVSSANSPLSSSDVSSSSTTEVKKSIVGTVAYVKRIQQTKPPRQQNRQESTANESSHVDVEDSSDESDNASSQTNMKNNSVYSEDELFVKNLKSKKLVVRLERIQADASLLINPNPSNENILFATSNSQTTSDDPGPLQIDCNGINSDISSHSDSMPNDNQAPTITNHAEKEKKELKSVPVESDKLKHLKKICRAAELYVKYKKEFEHLKSDAAKCQRLQQILENAGMQGKPSFKAAERLRLLKEAKELNEENIIPSDSGRTRRKPQDLFTHRTSKDTIDIKPEQFANLVGIVDSEGSENNMESI